METNGEIKGLEKEELGGEEVSSNALLQMRTALAAELKISIDRKKLELEKQQEEFLGIQAEIIRILEAMDAESIKIHGFNFYVEEKASVRVPKTIEEKRLLFAYLKEQGLFEEMVSVNSQTLNSFYKSMAEQAAAEGNLDFRIPGVEEPSSYKQLKMRRISK